MLASTTQQTFDSKTNGNRKQSSDDVPTRTPLNSNIPELPSLIQQHDGACWGTFRFEDALGDYSSDVSCIRFLFIYQKLNIQNNSCQILYLLVSLRS